KHITCLCYNVAPYLCDIIITICLYLFRVEQGRYQKALSCRLPNFYKKLIHRHDSGYIYVDTTFGIRSDKDK
ncbi:hypothetical protein, partial [Escherichia coli]|uniref:hypothetical protein n=4 Tax=Escherichia coli TaxID=562 RepID=UPI001BC83D55